MKQTGYSGTPLKKKLGIKEGYIILLINPPDGYYDWVELDEEKVTLVKDEEEGGLDFIHFFVDDRNHFETQLISLKERITSNGMIWVSWPKKASKVVTDMSEDVIRNHAIDIQLVDVKVCSVNAIWSALKLVIPIKYRKPLNN